MFGFELEQLFRRRKWRWLFVSIALFVLAVFVGPSTNTLLPPVTVWDFVLSGLTQHFSVLIIFPALFLFLVVDLLIGDVNDGSLILILSRSHSRMSWLLAKIAVLTTSVLIFTLLCVLMYVIAGMVSGMTWEGRFSDNSLLGPMIKPMAVVSMITGLFLFTLTAFATSIVTLTLFTRSVILPWVIGMLLCMLSFFTFSRAAFEDFFVWLPASQMLLLAHIPNRAFESKEGFSLMWSFVYTFTLYLVAVLFCALRVRTMDLSKQE